MFTEPLVLQGTGRRHLAGRVSRHLFAVAVALALVVTSTMPAWGVVSSVPRDTASFDGRVTAVAYSGNTLYVGGSFANATDVDGTVAPRTRLAAIDVSTGRLLPWAPEADAAVYSLAVSGGDVYAGGAFTRVNGVRRPKVARIDGATGTVASFRHSIDGRVNAVEVGDGRLFVGGRFTTIDGQARTNLAAFDLGDGSLVPDWTPTTSDAVRALTATTDRIYVTGDFNMLNRSPQDGYLAAVGPVDGATDPTFDPPLGYRSFDVAVTSDSVYVSADGPGGHVRAFALDGSDRWDLRTDGAGQAVTVHDGVVYAGGHWDLVCDATGTDGSCGGTMVRRRKLVALSPDGAVLGWAPNANSALGVFAMASDSGSGTLAAGGDFTAFRGGTISQPHLAVFGP